MIYVIATIELVDAGRKDEFLAILKSNVPNVKAEDGCIMYEATVDFASGLSAQRRVADGVITIIEAWESREHLERHLKAPHMAAYREKVKGMVKPATLNVLEPA